MFGIVFNNLTMLFILILVGYIARKGGIINDSVNKGLSELLVKITLPCTVIASMIKPFSMELFKESGIVLMISAIIYLSGTAIGYLLAKAMKSDAAERNIQMFSLTFPNVGYMGFPVINAIYGSDALFYTSMANVTFNVLAFSLGVKLMNIGKGGSKASWRQIYLNNAMIATVIGFILFFTSTSPPQPVHGAITMLGNMTTPLSMLVVGAILAKSDVKKVFKGAGMYPVIFLRQLAIPAVVFFILRLFISNDMMLGVIVILAGMPIAALTAIFAEKYDMEPLTASKYVFVSTLLSLPSVPLLSLLL